MKIKPIHRPNFPWNLCYLYHTFAWIIVWFCYECFRVHGQ